MGKDQVRKSQVGALPPVLIIIESDIPACVPGVGTHETLGTCKYIGQGRNFTSLSESVCWQLIGDWS